MSRKKSLAVLTGVMLAAVSMLWCASAAAGQATPQKRTASLQKKATSATRHIQKLQRKADCYAQKKQLRATLAKANRRVVKLNRSVLAVNRVVLRADETSDTIIDRLLELNKKVRRLDTKAVRLAGSLRVPRKKYTASKVLALRGSVTKYTRLLAKAKKRPKPAKPRPSPTVSPTPTPAPTPTPTEDPTPTPEPTPSEDPTPTPEPTPSEDPTPTPEPAPSEDPTPTPEPTPSEDPTPTPEPAPSENPTPTPEPAPSENPTPTPEPTPSEDPTPTPEPTPSEDPTPTPEPTPSEDPTPTPEPTPTEDPTPTPEPTPSEDPTPTPEPTPESVTVAEYGATGDGVTDDTAAVNAALNAATQADLPVFFPSGTYKVSTLTVPTDTDIVGQSQSDTWLKGRLQLSGDSTVRDIKMGVIDSALRFVNGTRDTLLERVYFVGGGSMTSGDHQGVIRFCEDRLAERITFRDCTIGANERNGNGISIVDRGWSGATYRDIIWEECHFLGSPRMTFECIQRSDGTHAITTGYRNISFRDCLFEPSGSETISYDGGSLAGYSSVSGCTIKGAGNSTTYAWGQGVEFNGVTNMSFTGNTVYRTRGPMINHQGSRGTTSSNVFADNTFDSRVSYIPYVPELTECVIMYCNVDGALFENNTVITDAGGQVAYITGSSSNTFRNNTFKDVRAGDTAHQAVWLEDGSSNNQFIGNQFHTDWSWGHVCVYDGSNYNTFATNTFTLLGGRAFDIDNGLTVHQSGNIMN